MIVCKFRYRDVYDWTETFEIINKEVSMASAVQKAYISSSGVTDYFSIVKGGSYHDPIFNVTLNSNSLVITSSSPTTSSYIGGYLLKLS